MRTRSDPLTRWDWLGLAIAALGALLYWTGAL